MKIILKRCRRIRLPRAQTYVPAASTVPANALLGEDGQPILTEDGQYILV